ncbi:MAG: serine hydrolase domain-containing protein [Phycisphaeraceae bacterium]
MGCSAPAEKAAVASPPPTFDLEQMVPVDEAIRAAVEAGDIPGAVLLVGASPHTLYHKAYGHRAVQPETEQMTHDTIFDLASLSKVFSATAVMMLVDRGEVDVHAPVATYLPAFASNGKEAITVEQLLLHRGGLAPANPLSDFEDGAEAGLALIYNRGPRWEPGSRFAYTDVGYIVLGQLVEAVDGRPLDQFTHEEIFKPLGMQATAYVPPEDWRQRIAPTQQRAGRWMRGEVHDPRAYALGGVAGHAGLFSTTEDLARFCQMILNGGVYGETRILSSQIVETMTTPHAMPDGSNSRSYVFDVDTGYSSSPRGDGFAVGSTFGHTGFTGTSFWLDAKHKTYVILLTNRVHPDGNGRVAALRRAAANGAAAAIMATSEQAEKQ